jgi:hypothetical protein
MLTMAMITPSEALVSMVRRTNRLSSCSLAATPCSCRRAASTWNCPIWSASVSAASRLGMTCRRRNVLERARFSSSVQAKTGANDSQ